MKLIDAFVFSLLSLTTHVRAGPTPVRRSNAAALKRAPPAGFAYSQGGNFLVDGKKYDFAGTNAYWLSQLNSEADIDKVLADIAAQGSKVVRTWCFREVVAPLPAGTDPATYTAVWNNGKQTLNQPGLDRILYIIEKADLLGLKIHCSLTNNWAPTYKSDAPRPLGYYSNSFGGADTYVQQLKPGGHHDDFFSDEDIKAAYKVFLKWIVNALKDKPALFAWELANDPRCQGASGTTTSSDCKTTTITKWVNDLGAFVKSQDPNHMVSSGDHGFFCTINNSCPKINIITPAPATASKRATTGRKVRSRRGMYLTEADIYDHRKAVLKRAAREATGPKKMIRGGWAAPPAADYSKIYGRQSDSSPGSSFDGTYGVDTEDINNSPSVDFSSFQFFPDQNTYGSTGSDSSPGPPPGGAGGANFGTTLQEGVDWIAFHSDSSQTFGKPSTLTGFGLVSQDSSSDFQPFSSTAVGSDSSPPSTKFATESQKQTAYSNWTSEAVKKGINGITSYQEGTSGLTSKKGSVVDNQDTSGNSGTESSVPGRSPNDGYSNASSAVKNIFAGVGAAQNGKDSS